MFDVVEVDTSFYRPPASALAEGWLRKSRGGFVFTVKVWRRLTHEEEPFAESDARPFKAGIEPLRRAGALGCLLAQFPWSFRDTPANRARIEALRGVFEGEELVVEVRHASWNTDGALAFLRGLGVGFCNIDAPASSEGLTGTRHLTSGTGYVRLHGRNRKAWFDPAAGRDEKYNYLYSETELSEWIEAVRELERRGAPRVFVIANNHYGGQAVANALQIKASLSGAPVEVPDELLQAFPQLGKVARRAPAQPGLF